MTKRSGAHWKSLVDRADSAASLVAADVLASLVENSKKISFPPRSLRKIHADVAWGILQNVAWSIADAQGLDDKECDAVRAAVLKRRGSFARGIEPDVARDYSDAKKEWIRRNRQAGGKANSAKREFCAFLKNKGVSMSMSKWNEVHSSFIRAMRVLVSAVFASAYSASIIRGLTDADAFAIAYGAADGIAQRSRRPILRHTLRRAGLDNAARKVLLEAPGFSWDRLQSLAIAEKARVNQRRSTATGIRMLARALKE